MGAFLLFLFIIFIYITIIKRLQKKELLKKVLIKQVIDNQMSRDTNHGYDLDENYQPIFTNDSITENNLKQNKIRYAQVINY